MSRLRNLLSGRRKGAGGGALRPTSENTLAYPELEGRLELNTAALMDGAPPAGVGGRAQPERDPEDERTQRGPGEVDTKHLPG